MTPEGRRRAVAQRAGRGHRTAGGLRRQQQQLRRQDSTLTSQHSLIGFTPTPTPPKRLAHPRSPMSPLMTLAARATHEPPLHPAALASVPNEFVFVRVRVQLDLSEERKEKYRLLAYGSETGVTSPIEFRLCLCDCKAMYPYKSSLHGDKPDSGRRSRGVRSVEYRSRCLLHSGALQQYIART